MRSVCSINILLLGLLLLFAGCKKETIKELEKGSVTDIDGNTYNTVKIGEQWWMAEDLKVTKYADGTIIAAVESDTAVWNNDTAGAYCTGAYGMLYNWYAVKQGARSIAPAGWHIPTDAEWKAMEQYLGMSETEAGKTGWRGTHEGEKLKMTGIDNWKKYGDVWATNESGFTARAGNCRLFNGNSGEPFGTYYAGFWWTASESATNGKAWYRYLDYQKAGVFRLDGPKTYGFSVRCVKD